MNVLDPPMRLQRVLGLPRIAWMFVAPNLAIFSLFTFLPIDPKRHLLRLVGRALWRDYHQGRPRRATNFGDHRVLRINGVPQIEGPFSQET